MRLMRHYRRVPSPRSRLRRMECHVCARRVGHFVGKVSEQSDSIPRLACVSKLEAKEDPRTA